MEEIPDFLKRKKGEIQESAPVVATPHNSGECDPVVTPDYAGADTEPVVNPFDKIQQGIRESQRELRGEINERFDAFMKDGTSFSAYDYLCAHNIKPKIATGLITVFTPYVAEMQEALTGDDPETKAAYSCYTKTELKSHIEFLQSVIDDTNHYIGNKPRKPPKARKVDPVKKTSKLRFKKEDIDLKLVSINPKTIIGAQELWTYNPKTKHLTQFLARNRTGLSVDGTMIREYDVENSISKVLRNPEEILAKVLEKKKKVLDNLTTKVIVPSGRINEQTILVRVG